MSVVAVKKDKNKIEIASDSILVYGYTQEKDKNSSFAKLFEVNEMIIGGVGIAEEIFLFKTFCQTRKPEQASEESLLTFFGEFVEWKYKKTNERKISSSFIVVAEDKIFEIDNFLIREISSYFAIGAGQDYALTALYLGESVDKAIQAACNLSIYCELPMKKFVKKIK